jgi:hypothetical protein
MYIHAYGHQPAGNLGWFIDTRQTWKKLLLP